MFDTCPTEQEMDTCQAVVNPVLQLVFERWSGGEYFNTTQLDWNYFHPWVRNSASTFWRMDAPLINPVGFYHREVIAGENLGDIIEGCMHNGFPGDSGCIFAAGAAVLQCFQKDQSQWELFSVVQGGGGVNTTWRQPITGCPNSSFELLNFPPCPPPGNTGSCLISASVAL